MTRTRQALGTSWGLLRHYWIVVKLAITIVATIVLLLYTQTIDDMAALARTADLAELRNPSPVLHAAVGMLLLLVTTTLSVYKPRGRTRYGWRKQQQLRMPGET